MKKEGINFLELVPYRNIKWKRIEGNLVVLLKPKFKNPFFLKYILPRLKNPYYRIKLDNIGSYVWELCDGKNKVRDIEEKLREKFGKKIEPAHERLALFFRQLEKGNFIKFR